MKTMSRMLSVSVVDATPHVAGLARAASIIAGSDDSTAGALTKNASIRAGDDLGALDVKGSLIGNVTPNGTSLVIISLQTRFLL